MSTLKSLSSSHALLVDDDEFVRQSIELAISTQGVKVTAAGNARECLKLIEEHSFDFAIIDVGMPEINGIELCQQIRAMRHITQFPILVLSGYADKMTEKAVRLAGADDFLSKPFSFQEVITLLKKYMETKN